MRDDLSPAELDEIFYGPEPVVEAEFFSKRVLDVSASREAGERKYTNRDYIRLQCKKEGTFNERPANKSDHRKFPAAWKAYREEQDGQADVCATIPVSYAFAKGQG